MKPHKPKNYEYGINRIQEYIRDLYEVGWQLLFQWCPSHCGVRGNTQANSLA